MFMKVCGLTQEEDVKTCLSTGVGFLGFIFHSTSPRYISPEQVAGFPKGTAKRVGIFVHHSLDQILEIVHKADLDLIQLHGDYTPRDCSSLSPIQIMKVFWPERYRNRHTLTRDLEDYAPTCRYFLFDAGLKGGGHGQQIQSLWMKDVPCPRPWFLAGGLDPQNFQEFALRYRPDGLDFNSGLERAPGVKDQQGIRNVRLLMRD